MGRSWANMTKMSECILSTGVVPGGKGYTVPVMSGVEACIIRKKHPVSNKALSALVVSNCPLSCPITETRYESAAQPWHQYKASANLNGDREEACVAPLGHTVGLISNMSSSSP
jgi:hypothetical protein